MAKVIVKLKINDNLIVPKFSNCLLSMLKDNVGDETDIKIQLFYDHLLVSPYKECTPEHVQKHVLKHSKVCPIRALESEAKEPEQLNIPVAVSIILESSDHHILITKRSSKMRSSPGVWVPPGGHLERGESLIAGGLRELYEETGLRFKERDVDCELMCIWENVFPIILGFGTPKSHVLVIYYRVRCRQSYQQLTKKLKVNPKEVEAFAWLSPQVMREIFTSAQEELLQQTQHVYSGGVITESKLEYLKIFPRVTWTSPNVYSGVQCAFTEWYRRICRENEVQMISKI